MSYDHYNAEDLKYHHQLDQLFFQSEEPFSLDQYRETGVYVEEDRENGNLLIVLGETLLEDSIQQFYISDENHAYTRSYWKTNWEAWFKIPEKIIGSQSFDFDQLCSSDFLLIGPSANLQNAPLEFVQTRSEQDIIICMRTPNCTHLIQFLIGNHRSKFWIRHHDGNEWSDWTAFI